MLSEFYLQSPLLTLLAIGSLGAIIGSFLTVCIYRIPYGRPLGPPSFEEMNGLEEIPEADVPLEESVQEQVGNESGTSPETLGIGTPPRSFCPKCKAKLFWWHNIPVVSWFLLRGKCHFCKERISFRYPLVELLSAAVAVLSVYSFGLSATSLLVYVFCAALIVISFIDIDYYIIPDVISLPGTVIGILIGLLNHSTHIFRWPVPDTVWGSLIGLAFGGGVLLFISEVYFRVRKRVGLGLGDVKLLAMTGAFFGFQGAFYTMFLGSLMGSVLGIGMVLFQRKGLNYQLPFGPYLAMGTALYLFSGRILG